MRRREFIAGLAGIVATVPARAQQPAAMRRLGILWPHNENDPTTKVWVSAFMLGLALRCK
jgi:hypothetical protein